MLFIGMNLFDVLQGDLEVQDGISLATGYSGDH